MRRQDDSSINPAQRTLHVALIGCGQIADAHLQELAKLPQARVVAVCDRHRDLARQAGARFGVDATYDDHLRMLEEVRPDVVHVTTPAQTHRALAIDVLEHDGHVYVEKPLALDSTEADEIIATARAADRLVCVGHDQLFDPAWLELRRRVSEGEIGPVRHVESVLGYPLSGQFGALVAADPQHWVRQLPGGLFHNTISHPLYRITEFLTDLDPQVHAHWFARGQSEFPTELRVHLQGRDVTGALLFDTGIASQRVTRVYGPRGCLSVDLDAQTVVLHRSPKLPGAFGRIETPWRNWRQSWRALRCNVGRFVRSDLHYFAGMSGLLDAFYTAILDRSAPPITCAEMRRVTQLMDSIFDCCREHARGSTERADAPCEPEGAAVCTLS